GGTPNEHFGTADGFDDWIPDHLYRACLSREQSVERWTKGDRTSPASTVCSGSQSDPASRACSLLMLLVSPLELAASAARPHLCQPAAGNAASTCPEIYEVGNAAGTCSVCAQGIPTLADGGLATVPVFISCGKCAAFLGKLDTCAIAPSHRA